MINTQYINLNMIPSGVMPVLYCSQYDVGRPLGVVVYNGAESVDLSGYTCTIEATRTDKTPVTAGVTTSGNIGVFETTATMTNQADTYKGKLVLTDGNGKRVASLAFVLVVTVRTMDEDAEEIEEDASLYQQYTGTVQTIIASIRADLAAEITARQNAISTEASTRAAAVSAEAAARQSADSTLQSNINAEASTRATQDASLQSQINQLIAPSGSAPSAAEVENARIGSDGTVYPTLGDAIRTQNSLLKSQLNYSLEYITDVDWWVQNAINANTGANYNSSNTIRFRSMMTREDGIFAVKVASGKMGLHAWNSQGTYIGFWKNGTFQKSTSVSAAFVLTGEIDLTQFYDLGYKIMVEYRTDDNADITPATAYNHIAFVRSVAIDNEITIEQHNDTILHQLMTDVTKSVIWQQGGIYEITGQNAVSNNYIRTNNKHSTIDIIIVENDLHIYVYGYAENGDYVGYKHISDDICVITKDVVPGAAVYRIVIGKKVGSATLSDVSKIKLFYRDDAADFTKNVNSRSMWEIGGIGSEGTNFDTRNWNIRTDYLEDIHKITLADGYSADISTYDGNKVFLGRYQGYTSEIYVDYAVWKCKYIRIELISGSTEPLTNVDTYANASIYAYLDSRLCVDGIAADAGSVGRKFEAQFTNWMSQSRYSDTTNARILTLMHFSDIHDNLSAMKKAMSLIGQYSAKIDDAIHTGDVTLTNLGQGILNWIQSGCADVVLGVVGNHDTYADGNLSLNSATQEEVYNTLFADYISGWNVVQPTGVDDSESDYYCACYYYKDYTTPQIRLIVLDSERWDENELTWFVSVLDDARTNGYAVVVASHCAPGAVTGLHGNWNYIGVEDFTSSTPTYARITEDAPNAIDAFVENGGEFILWISGHFHRGGFGHLANHPNIFVMVAEKASIARTTGAARISGESNEYAFNMLSVDASDKLVRMVRYGSNADAWLRPRNVFTYNYDTHTVVYEG